MVVVDDQDAFGHDARLTRNWLHETSRQKLGCPNPIRWRSRDAAVPKVHSKGKYPLYLGSILVMSCRSLRQIDQKSAYLALARPRFLSTVAIHSPLTRNHRCRGYPN